MRCIVRHDERQLQEEFFALTWGNFMSFPDLDCVVFVAIEASTFCKLRVEVLFYHTVPYMFIIYAVQGCRSSLIRPWIPQLDWPHRRPLTLRAASVSLR